ncbi:MAG: hypothetical protein ABI682_17580 [Acidobacteriota bacterium]
MDETGVELDRRVVQTLFDDWPGAIPEFSRRDGAADYVLRFLRRMCIAWRIRLVDGTWECELSTPAGRMCAGRARTRPLAVARAVVDADVNPGRRRIPAAPPRLDASTRERPLRKVRDCGDCGVELTTARSAPLGVRYCNLCGWRRMRFSPEQQAR